TYTPLPTSSYCATLVFFILPRPRPQKFTLFPYTTLFRSGGMYLLINTNGSKYWRMKYRFAGKEKMLSIGVYPDRKHLFFTSKARSEEHTSELQSRFDLVCRLLLEKKKQIIKNLSDSCAED